MPTISASRVDAMADLVQALLGFQRALRLRGAEWADSPSDLSTGDVVVLGLLGQHGAMRPGRIAARLSCGPSVVSRRLATLGDAGLLVRDTDPLDGRADLVSLSRSGRERLGELHDVMAGRLAQRLDRWGEDDVRRATELLGDLVEQLLVPARSPAGDLPAPVPQTTT